MKNTYFFIVMFITMTKVGYAQIFEQKFEFFNYGEKISKYIKADDPGNSKFTYISSNGAQRSGIINGGLLRFVKTGPASAQLVKSGKFNANSDFLYVTFSYRISENESVHPSDKQAFFFVGDGFSNDAKLPDDAKNVHSKFSFHYTGPGKFKVSDTKDNLSTEFSGEQQITFVINNTGKDQVYTAPNKSKEKLANDKWDLWIGENKVFDEREALSPDVILSGFKFHIQAHAINAITDLGNFVVHNLETLSKSQRRTKIIENEQYVAYQKSFVATKRWLQIPVKNRATKRGVRIDVDGKWFKNFSVELANETPDWYAYVDLNTIKGKAFVVSVDSLPLNSSAFTNIKQLDEKPKDELLYREKYRGQIHYSVKNGCSTDANGMTFYNGEYHLFYQHNPYGTRWGNMHWGHAVSKDLVHWKELDIAIYPDELGDPFSGGGVVDVGNTSGLSKTGKDPMILYYTATGIPRTQTLAYSTDGRTFEKLGRPVLKGISPFNRDPKVLWHEPTKKWVMVLYIEEKGELHTMRFFNSTNMIDWEETSVYVGGKGQDRYMYECPEFYELPVEGNPGEKKWILVCADGQYAIGTFNGREFKAEQERLQSVIGKGYYASQQFSNEPNGRKIEMGWFRTNTDQVNMNFSQSFSIPMEIKLIRTSQGLRLVRIPVEEFKSLRKGLSTYKNEVISGVLTKDVRSEVYEVETVIKPQQASQLTVNIRGIIFTYMPSPGKLVYKDQTIDLPLENGKLKIHAFVDKTSVELFVNDGLVFIPVNANLDAKNTSIAFGGEGALVEHLSIYKLESIW